ncbi:hypothetical protein BGX27_010778 [Mortierella sp. AM989]|nr:hypothetical protein BGX27_010778 [Mortierella sp. AM989]
MIQLAILSSKVDTAMSQMSTNAKMKFTSSMQAKRLLRGQWRPALMLTTTMAAITVFWLFYYVDAHRLSNISTQTIWVQDWLTCVKSSGYAGLTSDEAQTKCAIMIKSNLPSIPWFGAAETLISIIGIIVAVIFVSKVEFWSEWSGVIYGLLGRKKPGTDSESQSPPVATDKSPVLDRSSSYQYNDPNMRKGIRVGYNDELPVHLAPDNKALPGIDALEVPQQYDMDDLLDKEYDLQETDLQRNTSYGSFKAETVSPSSQIPNAEPPRYLATTIQDPYPDDILYPSTAKKIEPWSASSHTIASPSKAYLIANDNSDRYVEQPMVPRPVPRASLKFKNNQQQVQQQLIISASPPQSPTYVQTPLSPMPPKPSNQSSTPFLPRKKEPDSVPIVSGVQGSPAIGYVNPPSAKAKLFDSNESNEKIMVASRESVTGYNNGTIIGRGLSKILSHRQSSDLMGRINPKTKAPAALDLQIETQTPPSIPLKSPARRQNSVSRGQLQQQYQQNESQGSYSQSRSPPTFPLEPSQ